jgi:hypothetical protein
MTRIARSGRIRTFAAGAARRRHGRDFESQLPDHGGRALVPVEPSIEERVAGDAASSPVVAQMLAAKLGLPQTRRLRRAAPLEASSLYADAGQRIAHGREHHQLSWQT